MTYEEYKNLKKGQWIFTCSMKPLQFSHIDVLTDDDRKHWDMPDEKWETFKYDSFYTIEGSNHSKENCSCKTISGNYAQWFLKNEIHTMYDKFKGMENSFTLYVADVQARCFEAGIEYEGI
jgi:hypothetical protein